MHGQAINPHMTKHMAPSHVPVQSPLKPLPHMPMIVAFAAPSNLQLSPSHVMSHWAVPEQSNVQPPPYLVIWMPPEGVLKSTRSEASMGGKGQEWTPSGATAGSASRAAARRRAASPVRVRWTVGAPSDVLP